MTAARFRKKVNGVIKSDELRQHLRMLKACCGTTRYRNRP